MTIRVRNRATASRQVRLLLMTVTAFLSVLLGTSAGCQGGNAPLSRPAQILLDSSLAGKEAMYDSSTANLAVDRLTCLEARAYPVLGQDEVSRIARLADRTVRARHSRAEYVAGLRGIGMVHDEPTAEFCTRIDSLWYVMVVKQAKARR
ncbi:MAG: hypothetical protein ACYC3L_08405 [Gemmatimonadaceae bacterium]